MAVEGAAGGVHRTPAAPRAHAAMASAGRAGPVARAPAPDRAPRAARGAARTLVYVPRYRLLANAHAAELSRVAPVPPARLPLPRVPTGGRSRPSVPVRALRPPPPSVSRRPAAPWQQPQLRAAERPRYVPRHRALIATARQDELQGWRQGRWLERRAGRVPPPPQTAAAALNAGEGTRAIAGAGNRSVPAHATGAALPDARARATAPVFAARPPAPAPAGTSGSPAKPSVARGRSSVVRASSKAPAPAPARAPAPTCASASAVARASGPAPARAPASASAPARAPRSARLLACAPGVSCTLAELPREVLHAVLRRLPARSLAACMCASRSLRAAAGEATLWDAATSAAGIALEAEARAEDAVDECASSVRAGSGGGHGAAGGVASCEQRGSARAAVATAGPAAARGRQLRSCFGAAVRARANWTHGRYASRALAGAHTWAVEALRFTRARGCGTRHRDGERLLVSGAWDGQVAAWRVRDGARAARFRGHGDWVTTLDTDGALIVSGATDGTLRAWGWDSPEPLAHFYVGSAVTCVCLLEGLAVLTQKARAGDGSTIPNGGTLSCSAWPHVIACSASDGSVHVFGVDGARRRSVRLTEPLTRAHPQTAWFVKPVLGGVRYEMRARKRLSRAHAQALAASALDLKPHLRARMYADVSTRGRAALSPPGAAARSRCGRSARPQTKWTMTTLFFTLTWSHAEKRTMMRCFAWPRTHLGIAMWRTARRSANRCASGAAAPWRSSPAGAPTERRRCSSSSCRAVNEVALRLVGPRQG